MSLSTICPELIFEIGNFLENADLSNFMLTNSNIHSLFKSNMVKRREVHEQKLCALKIIECKKKDSISELIKNDKYKILNEITDFHVNRVLNRPTDFDNYFFKLSFDSCVNGCITSIEYNNLPIFQKLFFPKFVELYEDIASGKIFPIIRLIYRYNRIEFMRHVLSLITIESNIIQGFYSICSEIEERIRRNSGLENADLEVMVITDLVRTKYQEFTHDQTNHREYMKTVPYLIFG